MKKKIIILLAGVLALFGAGATVAAPPAQAADRVTALKICESVNYGGICTALTRSNAGAPDSYPGYFIELSSWQKNNISSVRSAGTGGNYIYIYEKTWAGTWGNICYSGYLNVPYVGDSCNDRGAVIRLMTR